MSQTDWNLIVCGGGSGGHLFPALAVLEQLELRSQAPARVIFLTGQRSIEKSVLDTSPVHIENYPVSAVESPGFFRNPLRSLLGLWKSVREAKGLIRDVRPSVVLGIGGYCSLPGVLAARQLRYPVILMEQNLIPGRATSRLASLAKVVCTSFQETAGHLPKGTAVQFTGNPLRQSILRLKDAVASHKRHGLLILGGSQGATGLNEALVSLAEQQPDLLQEWHVLHQTGETDQQRMENLYREHGISADVQAFFSDMEAVYEQTAFAVTRAGATSLAELACAGIPALVVPYPKSVRDHQLINARWYQEKAAAVVVEQGRSPAQLNQELAKTLPDLLEDVKKRTAMGRAMKSLAQYDAAEQVADVVIHWAQQVTQQKKS